MKPNDHLQRRQFADCAPEQLEIDPDFGKKIILSDGAQFWLNGFVNKQNCRNVGDHDLQEIQQRSLHSEKVIVRCGYWSGDIIELYFFQNEAGAALTVNGEQ